MPPKCICLSCKGEVSNPSGTPDKPLAGVEVCEHCGRSFGVVLTPDERRHVLAGGSLIDYPKPITPHECYRMVLAVARALYPVPKTQKELLDMCARAHATKHS